MLSNDDFEKLLRAESEAVQNEAGGEMTSRAIMLQNAAAIIFEMRKTLAFIPAKVVIKAREEAGFAKVIRPKDSPKLCRCGRTLHMTGPDDADPWCSGCTMSAKTCDCASVAENNLPNRPNAVHQQNALLEASDSSYSEYELGRSIANYQISRMVLGNCFRFIDFGGKLVHIEFSGESELFSEGLRRLCDNVTGQLVDCLNR